MTQLTADNIKLYESEKLNDNADGGGRATAIEVQSGQVNNVFQDISRVDHTVGAVELRKLFMGVDTNNQAPLLGAHMIVSKVAADPNVNVTLFSTGSDDDVRADARDFLENYLVQSTQSFVEILGRQITGSRTLVLFQSLLLGSSQLPKSGETKVLYNTVSGVKEYVRLLNVQPQKQTFIYQSGSDYKTFDAWRIVCTLANPLQHDWVGGEARPNGTTVNTLEIYDTSISDAAHYMGTTKLKSAATAGDAILTVDSVLGALVPVAQSEQAMTDKNAAGDNTFVTAASTSSITLSANTTSQTDTLYTPTPITPGTLIISSAAATWQDDGQGGLNLVSGSVTLTTPSVDYVLGQVRVTGIGARAVTIAYQPGAAVTMNSLTGHLDITQDNRGLVYTLNLAGDKPRPGTFQVKYRSLGNWQTITDNGAGQLTGQGNGTINYSTGTVAITLLHDVDESTALVWSYAPQNTTTFELAGGAAQYLSSATSRSLSFNAPVKPGTVEVYNADTVSLTDNSAGVLSGIGGSGTVDYATGAITFSPSALGGSADFTIDADTGSGFNGPITLVSSGGGYGFDLGMAVAARGLVVTVPIKRTRAVSLSGSVGSTGSTSKETLFYRTYKDDGVGGLVDEAGVAVVGGSVNYSTGAVALGSVLQQYSVRSSTMGIGSPTVSTEDVYEALAGKASVAAVSSFDSFTASSVSATLSTSNVQLTNPGGGKTLIPGSLYMTYGGENYYDKDGKIYRTFSALTGAGVEAGSINYDTGAVSIAALPSSGAVKPTVVSLLAGNQPQASNWSDFVTESAPIRPGSLQLTLLNLSTGETVTASADANGTISNDAETVAGTVDSSSGFVSVQADFPVFFGQIRYNAVALNAVPLDPDIIGLNTVRLPADGKVPIFQVGDVAVLNNTQTDTLSTPTASATVTLSRDHLAEVTVYGADGATALDPEQYTVDLEEGTITYSATLVLQDADAVALSGPWKAVHRIEHMSLVTDVQLNGRINLQAPSAHDFPIGSTVSSALLFGDLQSDVTNVFTQRTWNSNSPNWGTEPDASGTTSAQYNTVAYPIGVANNGAVAEKWALVFTSTNAFSIVSETRGVIGTGGTNVDCSPLNPMTGTPYFTVLAAGWGSGWANGNALRFDTLGALAPFWIARTVVPGQGVTSSDSFTLSPRGDSQ